MPQKRTIPRICAQCGIDFLAKLDTVKNGGAKFCSKACFGASCHSRIALICANCSKSFTVKSHLTTTAVTCSLVCKRQRHGSTLRKAASISFTCEHCGIESLLTKRQSQGGERRFCSVRCRNASMQLDPVVQYWGRAIQQDGCWGWDGKTDRNGYPYFDLSRDGKTVTYRANRLALEIAAGVPIPSGMNACHACDNPTCTKNDDPDIYIINGIARPRFGHLWIGTQSENAADMVLKGHGRGRFSPTKPGPFGYR